jgi:UDP-N-acetylglucosamine 2-epimerase
MCRKLLDNAVALERMSAVHHPYGNGRAAESIVDALATVLEGAG